MRTGRTGVVVRISGEFEDLVTRERRERWSGRGRGRLALVVLEGGNGATLNGEAVGRYHVRVIPGVPGPMRANCNQEIILLNGFVNQRFFQTLPLPRVRRAF